MDLLSHTSSGTCWIGKGAMDKRLKTVISILVTLAISVNLTLLAFQLPILENDSEVELEIEVNDQGSNLFENTLSLHFIDAITNFSNFHLDCGYLLRLFQTNLLFIPFYKSDLKGLSPPLAHL
ncbi:MAG: hypothetical protein JXR76_30495 [Deltaproteobacteria bacterium]|nr:hypothetical protein [Deltaproteobacteria bacterium]